MPHQQIFHFGHLNTGIPVLQQRRHFMLVKVAADISKLQICHFAVKKERYGLYVHAHAHTCAFCYVQNKIKEMQCIWRRHLI